MAKDQPETHLYLILCLGGAERLVSRLIQSHLAPSFCSVQVLPQSVAHASSDCQKFDLNEAVPGSTGVGKLIVETDASPRAISSLRWVQRVLSLLGQAHDLDALLGSPNSAETCFVNVLQPQLCHAWYPSIFRYMEFARKSNAQSFTFRVSGLRGGGKHGVTSMSAAGHVGAILLSTAPQPAHCSLPTPVVNLEEYDAEVVVLIYGTSVVVALTLPTHPHGMSSPPQTKGKAPAEAVFPFVLRPSREFSLRPSTAAVLIAIAVETEKDPGGFADRLLADTMSGVGTIPIEAAISYPAKIGASIGGDLAVDVISTEFGAHLKTLQKLNARPVEAAAWDSTNLPLRQGVLDLAVVDAPFGVKCGKWHTLDKLLSQSLSELSRVLRPGGRALILTHSTKKFRLWMRDEDWDNSATETRLLNIGGLLITLFILTTPQKKHLL